MSTAIWPPIPPDELAKEEEACLARELVWLLASLQETLQSLKSGLDEVSALLAPSEQPSILVMSSYRSESLKGFVTRDGARIIKGDIKLKLSTLPPPKGMISYPVTVSTEPQAGTIVLNQLTTARTLINACLDVVDITNWAGDKKDANFISGQMRLLDVNLQEAKAAIKGGTSLQIPWYRSMNDESAFNPPLQPNTSVHFYINEAALILEVRTLEPLGPGGVEQHSSFSLRGIGFALGAVKPPTHDEVDDIFSWRGQDVKVREKVRVESSDPKLMAALAKLNSIERTVALARKALDALMGQEN